VENPSACHDGFTMDLVMGQSNIPSTTFVDFCNMMTGKELGQALVSCSYFSPVAEVFG
jgi:hypothetical protein